VTRPVIPLALSLWLPLLALPLAIALSVWLPLLSRPVDWTIKGTTF
jgi:hypothetical protein